MAAAPMKLPVVRLVNCSRTRSERAAFANWGGARPAAVDPYAGDATREMGIDISVHRSTSVEQIDAAAVKLVITPSAENVRPIVPSHGWRQAPRSGAIAFAVRSAAAGVLDHSRGAASHRAVRRWTRSAI